MWTITIVCTTFRLFVLQQHSLFYFPCNWRLWSFASMRITCVDVADSWLRAAAAPWSSLSEIHTHNGDTNSALLPSATRLDPTRSTVNNAQTRSDQPIPSNVPSGLETRSPVPPQLCISTKRRVGSRRCVLPKLKISSGTNTTLIYWRFSSVTNDESRAQCVSEEIMVISKKWSHKIGLTGMV